MGHLTGLCSNLRSAIDQVWTLATPGTSLGLSFQIRQQRRWYWSHRLVGQNKWESRCHLHSQCLAPSQSSHPRNLFINSFGIFHQDSWLVSTLHSVVQPQNAHHDLLSFLVSEGHNHRSSRCCWWVLLSCLASQVWVVQAWPLFPPPLLCGIWPGQRTRRTGSWHWNSSCGFDENQRKEGACSLCHPLAAWASGFPLKHRNSNTYIWGLLMIKFIWKYEMLWRRRCLL